MEAHEIAALAAVYFFGMIAFEFRRAISRTLEGQVIYRASTGKGFALFLQLLAVIGWLSGFVYGFWIGVWWQVIIVFFIAGLIGSICAKGYMMSVNIETMLSMARVFDFLAAAAAGLLWLVYLSN